MTTRDHQRFEEDLAPYLLGALPEAEAEALEGHLRRCAACREEVERLRVGAEALARAVDPVDPPASLREKVMGPIRAEATQAAASEAVDAPTASEARAPAGGSRWSRWLPRRAGRPAPALRPALALSAVALTAAAAGLVGWALARSDVEEPRTLAAVVDRDRLPTARGKLTVLPGDRSAVLRLSGLPRVAPEETYELWVMRDDRAEPGPLFHPSAKGQAVTGLSGDLDRVDAVLVTRERAGGARTPSEQPVIRVPLS